MLGSWVDRLLPLAAAPFAGSFLGTLVRRLPLGRPVVLGRSACESCGRVLRARDMVPLLSFVWLHGRCRACHARIAPFHWRIELAAVAVAGWAVLAAPDAAPPGAVWADCALGWGLLALALIDLRHLRLPDALTLPLVLLGLAATAWLDAEAAPEHALAALLGFGAFQGLSVAYRRLRHRDGLGGGDAKLLAASGAWVGLDGLPGVILGAALLAILVVLSRRIAGRRDEAGTPIPFGPYLALATWVSRLHLGH